jgi:hypothetical protein
MADRTVTEYEGNVYLYQPERFTYTDAQNFCTKCGANLVTITTAAENDFVAHLL